MRSSTQKSSVAGPLWGAGVCLVGLALTWVAANLLSVTHVQDAVALRDFTELSRPLIDAPANLLLGLLEPLPYACFALALVAAALMRERPRTALAVALVSVTAPSCTELLKPLMAHPHAFGMIANASWPSGHSTAAMTLVLCGVIVVPRRLRALVAALGSCFAIAVGFSLLVLAWHMPSDVFAGYLIAGFWSALAVAALYGAERRWPSAEASLPSRRRTLTLRLAREPGVLVASLALAGASVVALMLHKAHLAAFALDRRALVVAAAGIAALAVGICTTLTAALRR